MTKPKICTWARKCNAFFFKTDGTKYGCYHKVPHDKCIISNHLCTIDNSGAVEYKIGFELPNHTCKCVPIKYV